MMGRGELNRLAIALAGLIAGVGIALTTPLIATSTSIPIEKQTSYGLTTESPSPRPNTLSSSDMVFLNKIREAGFTETTISDDRAIDAAHKIVYWVCDRPAPSRLDVENLLFNFGIAERRGPGSVSTFAGAALEAYRHSSDPTNC